VAARAWCVQLQPAQMGMLEPHDSSRMFDLFYVFRSSELMMQWNSFSENLFQMRTEGALDCSIM
jgi:hypothetical protein